MPSQAFLRFERKLKDVQNLLDIHRGRSRQYQVLHKSGIVFLVAAWETYVEALIEEGVQALSLIALTGENSNINYPILQELVKANVAQITKRLNTANSSNVKYLFTNAFGIADIRASWGHSGLSSEKSYQALDQLLSLRHSIVHGDDREFHKSDLILWRRFLRAIVRNTDNAVSKQIEMLTGSKPW